MKAPVSKLVGYSVIGRHGFLGTVVGNDSAYGQPAEEIVFRGGVSDSLLFHLPATRLRSISPSRRTVTVEVDVGDFVPRPGEGGTVELYIVRQRGGCELTVLSNSLLGRDDQIGCFVFTPIDELEARLTARDRQRRARTEASAT